MLLWVWLQFEVYMNLEMVTVLMNSTTSHYFLDEPKEEISEFADTVEISILAKEMLVSGEGEEGG